jgi:undecaprenyl-diphosphatase
VRIVRAWWSALRGSLGTSWRARVGAPVGAPADHDALLAWFIVLGSLPIIIFGVLFQHAIEQKFRNLWLIVLTLAVFGLLLGWADKVGVKRRGLEEMTGRHAIQFGLWQSLALVPGVSRSGATVVGGMLSGASKRAAAEFTFFVALPIMVGAFGYDLYKSRDLIDASIALNVAIGFAAAFVVGAVVVRYLLNFVSRYGFAPFAWWRIAVGIFGLVGIYFFGK